MANREKNEHLRHTSYRLEKEQRERKIGRVIFEMKRSKERMKKEKETHRHPVADRDEIEKS